MKIEKREHPPCFGILEQVFPKHADGLRQTPDTCLQCPLKVACLRAAVSGSDGLRVQEEVVDRAYRSGVMSFFQRWSKKKYLRGRLTQRGAKPRKG